ncbi:MAG: MBL fold metallo-hydrolase [Methanolinea sp.]|nr:MBL fold metallo-hydrolase [Methanolinea sp.]
MRVRVLVDNSTLIDHYFLAEPGFSALVETEGGKVLFDLGYSRAFLENARKMGEDLLDIRYVVLSHGHLDHTWGMVPFIMALTGARIEKRPCTRPTLVAHPGVFSTKKTGDLPETGSLMAEEKCREHFDLVLSREPVWISPDLVFLGEIPRRFSFEEVPLSGKRTVRGPDGCVPDPLLDDSALAFTGKEGIVIVTGCSHAGICNIAAYAREVCGEERVRDIIGGFHLTAAPASRLEKTVSTLAGMGVVRMHPCHCTGFAARCRFSGAFQVEEVGSGWECEYR